MQTISNDKTVRNDTLQDLKGFNSQSLSTRAKKGEQLAPMMPATKKDFDLMSNDIVYLSKEDKTMKNQIGDYDGKWLEESKTRLLKKIDDEKRAILNMYKMKKQMEKQ